MALLVKGISPMVRVPPAWATMFSTAWRMASRSSPRLLRTGGGDPLSLAQEPEEQVLGADGAVLQPARLLAREEDDLADPFGELVVHRRLPSRLRSSLADLGTSSDVQRLPDQAARYSFRSSEFISRPAELLQVGRLAVEQTRSTPRSPAGSATRG